MEMVKRVPSCAIVLICATLIATVHSIGVNYGTISNNLPPPAQVAQFLKEKTIIDRIKIFDVNADILRAFANTGILVTVTVPNHDIPALSNVEYARKWLESHIKPFHPQTKINYICLGNEVLHWGPQNLRDNLVAAMKSVNQALVLNGMTDIKVTTPHSLAILEFSEVPSAAKFKSGWDKAVIAPMLQFLRETKSPFMVNPYPYFGYNPKMDSFALFKTNNGVIFDKVTSKWYSNMYDMLLDAVYVAMKNLGYADVDIVVGEAGWPSKGESWLPQNTAENAAIFNGALLRKSISGEGTPLMPNKKFETYIFALFNENLKEGSLAEKNFGLFQPDFTPVYNIGIMKGQLPLPAPKPEENKTVVPQPASSKKVARRSRKVVPRPTSSKKFVSRPASSKKVFPQPASSKKVFPRPASSKKVVRRPTSSKKVISRPGSPKKVVSAQASIIKSVPLVASHIKSVPPPASPINSVPPPASPAPVQGQGQGQGQGQKWCIPKLGTPKSQLLKTVNYLCQSNLGIDCKTILEDAGACFHPNNLHMKATYVMNAYYHLKGKKDSDCDFFQFGYITTQDPSFGTCKLQG